MKNGRTYQITFFKETDFDISKIINTKFDIDKIKIGDDEQQIKYIFKKNTSMIIIKIKGNRHLVDKYKRKLLLSAAGIPKPQYEELIKYKDHISGDIRLYYKELPQVFIDHMQTLSNYYIIKNTNLKFTFENSYQLLKVVKKYGIKCTTNTIQMTKLNLGDNFKWDEYIKEYQDSQQKVVTSKLNEYQNKISTLQEIKTFNDKPYDDFKSQFISLPTTYKDIAKQKGQPNNIKSKGKQKPKATQTNQKDDKNNNIPHVKIYKASNSPNPKLTKTECLSCHKRENVKELGNDPVAYYKKQMSTMINEKYNKQDKELVIKVLHELVDVVFNEQTTGYKGRTTTTNLKCIHQVDKYLKRILSLATISLEAVQGYLVNCK